MRDVASVAARSRVRRIITPRVCAEHAAAPSRSSATRPSSSSGSSCCASGCCGDEPRVARASSSRVAGSWRSDRERAASCSAVCGSRAREVPAGFGARARRCARDAASRRRAASLRSAAVAGPMPSAASTSLASRTGQAPARSSWLGPSLVGAPTAPGHGEHVAALVGGVARGDERAAARARLDHDDGARERADQPVAQREVVLRGRRAERAARSRTAPRAAISSASARARADRPARGRSRGPRR